LRWGRASYTSGEVVTASVPDDYRLRHPIAIEEADRSVAIFVGHAARRPVRFATRRTSLDWHK